MMIVQCGVNIKDLHPTGLSLCGVEVHRTSCSYLICLLGAAESDHLQSITGRTGTNREAGIRIQYTRHQAHPVTRQL